MVAVRCEAHCDVTTVHETSFIPGNLSGELRTGLRLVCQNASSFALFPGVITGVPAAQRTLGFPNSGGGTQAISGISGISALAWFGWIFVCLGRAGSAPGPLSSWDHLDVPAELAI